MKHTSATMVAAGVLIVCALTILAGPCAAQGRAERTPVPETLAPGVQGKGQAAPARPRPRELIPDEDMQVDRDDAPGFPQGCPDQGRKLELTV